MFLKIMSDEDLPDEDPRKSYTLFEKVDEVKFARESRGGGTFVQYIDAHGTPVDRPLYGNAYVFNDIGHLISSFGVASPYAPGEDDEPEPEGYHVEPGWPFGPSGGPIPGETPPICTGYHNLDAAPYLGIKSEPGFTDDLSERFELLRIPDSADVVIRDKVTGEGAILAGEGQTGEDAQGPTIDTFEALQGQHILMAEAFHLVQNAGLIVPKDALDARLDGGRERRQKQIESYKQQIRTLENDRPFLLDLVLGVPESHFDSLVSAAVFCAVSARGHDPVLVPETIKSTGGPDRIGDARLFELIDALNAYLKKGDVQSRQDLAISAMRLYAWENKVRSTSDEGYRAMENLRNVADAVLTA
jgi:hypothetical protein